MTICTSSHPANSPFSCSDRKTSRARIKRRIRPRRRRIPPTTTTTTTNRSRIIGNHDINLPRQIRTHVQPTQPIEHHAHGPEAGVGTFGIVRVGEDVGGRVGAGGRSDGGAVGEVEAGDFVADGVGPVPVIVIFSHRCECERFEGMNGWMDGWMDERGRIAGTYQLP